MSKRNPDEQVTLIERIPQIDRFFLCFNLRCGSLFTGICGLVVSNSAFLSYLLLLGRFVLNPKTIVLLMLLALLALANTMLLIASIMLIVAACCETPDLIPAYIWMCIIYWAVQLTLGIFIPVILLLEGGKSLLTALAWSSITMFLFLVWTHYLATVKSYMWQLYGERE